MLPGMIKSGLLLAAGVLIGGILVYKEQKEPCIRNFADSWIWYIEQAELTDIDDTETEKKFHDMILSVVKDQKNLYTSKYGKQYIVPSYCYVEDSGFRVTLWEINQ